MSAIVDYKNVIERIGEKFDAKVHSPEEPNGMLTLKTDKDSIIPLLQFLRDDLEMQFIFLTDICAVHFPDKAEKFEVVYHIHSFLNNLRVRIKVPLSGDPKIPTAVEVFKCANWMERETYDFYGVIFEGHPNLKRILNVDEMSIFPMRKEYPLEDNTRSDKDDKMFGRINVNREN